MTIFTDCTKDKKEEVNPKKKTKFFKYIMGDMTTDDAISEPSDFDHVDLVRRRDKEYGFDLLVAYHEGEKGKNELWYLGEAGDEFVCEDCKKSTSPSKTKSKEKKQ